MSKAFIILPLAALAIGCAGGGGSTQKSDQANARAWSKEDRTAAKASIEPTTDSSAKGKLNICTIVQGDNIKIINFTDQSIRDVNVWIEGKFMTRVGDLPAQGSITLSRDSFRDTAGNSLADARDTRVTNVTIEQPDGIYKTLGPVMQK